MKRSPPSWDIRQISLSLPPGFEHRAGAIVHLVAQQLGELSPAESTVLETLVVPPLVARAGETDRLLASRVAKAIHRQVVGRTAEPGRTGRS